MRCPGFGEGERLQLHDAGAPRERVGDRLHEADRLRAGEEKSAGAPAIAIDSSLQVAKEAGRVLHVSGHYGPWSRDRVQCDGGSWWCGPRSERMGASANSDFHIRGVSSMARLAGCTLIR